MARLAADRTIRPAVFPHFPSAGSGLAPDAPDVTAGPTAAELAAAARREGFEAGVRDGRAQALASLGRRLSDAAAALAAATAALDARREALATEVATVLPGVVLALVEELLGRELADGAAPAAATIAARAARLAHRGGPVVLRLHPDGAAALGAGVDGVRVEGDPSLGAADWIVETPDGLLDGRLAARLESLRRLLLEAAA